MKTYNHTYHNQTELTQFINHNGINKYENILIQFFSGIIDEDQIMNVISQINQILPHATLIGATTSGEIIENVLQNHSMVLSFSVFEKTKLKSILIELDNFSSYDIGKQLSEKIVSSDTKAVILFLEALHTNAEDLFQGFFEVNPHIIIAGGKAGDNRNYKKTYIFNNNKIISHGGLVAVALDNPDLQVHNDYNYGRVEVGKEYTITKAHKNILYELDNTPIYDIYNKYLGPRVADNMQGTRANFPIVINKNGMKISRAVLQEMPDGGVKLGGNVEQGQKVKFACGHKESILNSHYQIYNRLKDYPAESIFIYSCSARKQFLGKDLEKEIADLPDIASTSGFIVFGEIFHTGFSIEFLNETMTFLILSENNAIQNISAKFPDEKISDYIIYALSNFSKTISDELTDLNIGLEQKVQDKVQELQTNSIIYLEAYKNIINKMQDGVWICDKNNNIISINPKFLELTEFQEQDIIGREYTKLYKELPIFIKTGNAGKEVFLNTKSGEPVPVSMMSIPFINEGKVFILKDLREIQKIKEEKVELEKMNKMKDEFISIASHELRTPVTSIRGYVSMILDGDYGEIKEELNNPLKVVHKNIEKLLSLIENMLDLSKLESGEMNINKEKISLSLFLMEIYNDMNIVAQKKNLKLLIECLINEEIFIMFDKIKLKQVFTNIISNAIKYTIQGSVKIKISPENNNKVKIEIIDTGIGIDQKDFIRVFTKFQQVESYLTRDQVYGSGLGVPIAQEILRKFDSDLFLTSEVGKGSNFYFSLEIN